MKWIRICWCGISINASSYGITAIVTTIANPQANAIMGRIHQVIANMLRRSNPLADPESNQFRIEQQLHATQWAINTTYHTTLKGSLYS